MRVQFIVTSTDGQEDGSGSVRMAPVLTESADNAAAYVGEPKGAFSLSILNSADFAQFLVGNTFNVDINPA